jgi:hypothetical protein
MSILHLEEFFQGIEKWKQSNQEKNYQQADCA